jgi:protoporphyrin/coproporphyrin ferrochelatase
VPQPFDAVLLIAFGGPLGPEDIRPFLANVLRGRRVAPGRVEEVAHHYELFGGVSPITDLTRRQAEGLRARLAADGPALPVFVGMRNWHPYLKETLAVMAEARVRTAIGLILAPHRSYSSCQQYKENVRDAQEALRQDGLSTPPAVVYTDDWHAHAGFVETCARHIAAASERLAPDVRERARLIFTAHSIPTEMAERFPYREQLLESARLIATRVGTADWALVYQSRSGRPEDPWLEPDVCEYLRIERARGLAAAILAPIGFVSDHVEVLYDLDREAADVCRAIGLPMARADAANDDPIFVDMLADVVRRTWERYAGGRPLVLAVTGQGSGFRV